MTVAYLDLLEAQRKGTNEEAEFLVNYGKERPEEPEAYTWLHRIRKHGNLFSGGLWNQPYLFLIEIRAAELGEAEHIQRIMTNKKIKAMSNAK